MAIKRIIISYGILISVGFALSSFAESENMTPRQQAANKVIANSTDNRTSLNLSPELKVRQLAKMRSHFNSIQRIVSLIADDKFMEASEIARTNLVGGKGKKKLSAQINNDSFKLMGKAFHESAATLSEVLKTKNTKKSLQALNVTMGHCTSCHAVFRQ